MQFKVDENLPIEVADLLRESGHQASTINDQRMSGQVDPSIAEHCRQEKHVLITLDGDFADIRTYPPERYPGLIVLRLSQQDKPSILGVIGRILPLLAVEPLDGHLWVVDEYSIRVRGGSR